MAKSDYLTMRVEPELREELKQMAEDEHRTLTNMLTVILLRAVEQYKQEQKR